MNQVFLLMSYFLTGFFASLFFDLPMIGWSRISHSAALSSDFS